MHASVGAVAPKNSVRHILIASLVGTTIEFFDFYIYANAAVLVFPMLFFPNTDPAAARLESLATFAIAFFARPVGSAVFGHFGDRVGRKATLVAALLLMGISTVAIGLLPTYASIGMAAPLLLALCRVGQGLGLGGEWGGAVLLATENAPPGKRAWYGMFPQLGAPIGFILSGGLFLILSETLTDEQFFSFGWRIPFLASTALILVGLYVRLKITETPAFEEVLKNNKRVEIPTLTVFKDHTRALVLGVLIALATFVLFYLLTVFTQSWATTHLGYTRPEFLKMQLISVLFFGATIPISAILADRLGRRRVLMAATIAIALFGFLMGPMFGSGNSTVIVCFLSLGLGLMGMTYGPLGTMLSELFPAEVRFTGASLTFNLAGIFGASLAPYAAIALATNFGLASVGLYLSVAALVTLLGLLLSKETPSHRPIAVWIIVSLAIGTALYQFPTYHIPWIYAPIYFLGCGLLCYGFYVGARWAFVVNVLTAWIFPYETYIGVKGLLHGSILTALQVFSLGLMFWSWKFYWRKLRDGKAIPHETL